MRCRYNAIKVLQNHHKMHPTDRPLVRQMVPHFVHSKVILGRVIKALDCYVHIFKDIYLSQRFILQLNIQNMEYIRGRFSIMVLFHHYRIPYKNTTFSQYFNLYNGKPCAWKVVFILKSAPGADVLKP